MEMCRSIACVIVLLSIYYLGEAQPQGTCPGDRPFKCRVTFGECISLSNVCDGGSECPDGEDERNCGSCSGSAIMCNATKTCIYDRYVCDGTSHCSNREDELKCGTCPSNRPLKCNNTMSTCLQTYKKCDGTIHCPDGEDEKNCDVCPRTMIMCNSTKTCVKSSYACDGIYHCPNREDELYCDKCTSNKPLKCNSTTSTCIDSSGKCDGTFDCPDGEDERNCSICPNNQQIKCNRTASFTCIYRSDICDGRNDCGDEEDEENCSTCPSDRPFKCHASFSKCIHLSNFCDGGYQCPDGEDERNCANCTGSAFMCLSTETCIYGSYVCDGTYHCPNREDELNCDNSKPITTSTIRWPPSQFFSSTTSRPLFGITSKTSSTSASTATSEQGIKTEELPAACGKLGAGAYVGIIIGCILGVFLIVTNIFLLYHYIKQKRSKQTPEKAKQKSDLQLDGISNPAVKISEDKPNTSVSLDVQQIYYNVQPTPGRRGPKVNPKPTREDNTPSENNYISLNNKNPRESQHYYDTLKRDR